MSPDRSLAVQQQRLICSSPLPQFPIPDFGPNPILHILHLFSPSTNADEDLSPRTAKQVLWRSLLTMYSVLHSPIPVILNFTQFFNLNIFLFLFSVSFICFVVSSMRHSIGDLKHRSNLFFLMYVLAMVYTLFLNLLTLFQVRYLKILSVTSNKVMFGSHSDTFTLFISVWLITFTVKYRFLLHVN